MKWRMPLRAMAFALVLSLLTACATRPVVHDIAPDPAQARADTARRAAVQAWELSGRIAVSNGRQGGSGRIDWRQDEAGYTIALSAPVTRQSWQLIGNAQGARLEGIQGGPREGADAGELLLSATGWNIPVRALRDWIRGVAASPEFGPEQVSYGSDGMPARLEQAGWSITYEEWHAAMDGGPHLPRRIVARNGAASVKLVIDDWVL